MDVGRTGKSEIKHGLGRASFSGKNPVLCRVAQGTAVDVCPSTSVIFQSTALIHCSSSRVC